MNTENQAPFWAPKRFHFTDVDEFRSSIRTLNVDFTPLVRRINAEQVILSLPGCDVNRTRSFPRIVDAQLARDCTAVAFMMDDHEVPIRFNGAQKDRTAITIGGGGAAYTSVEEVERQYVSVMFTPEIRDRGWPETGPHFKVLETSRLAIYWLRRLVNEVLAAAAQPEQLADDAGMKRRAMRESLLAAIDAAFADVAPARWSNRANSERHFKIFQEIREILADDLGRPIYSEEIAAKVGVSVRSVHDAVQRYRGMSLHRYLRLRRLWLVRQRLLAGADSIKSVALAYGFWHLSDFSRSYRYHFGETPSDTLMHGRTS
jgi:AraC family ethanolamine operon transcriptional activator